MIKSITLLAFGCFVSFYVMAQEGWNWPKEESLKGMVVEKEAYYNLKIIEKEYELAWEALQWLYKNSPDLNPSIYINGASCVKSILKTEKNNARVRMLQDSLIWMFDQRIKYFGNDAKNSDRKVYEAFKFYYKDKEKYPHLMSFYEDAYQLNGVNISSFNLSNYVLLAISFHETNVTEMTKEMVMGIYEEVSDIIEKKINSGEDKNKLTKEQSKADAWLSTVPNLLDCDFIYHTLLPKYEADPRDQQIIKKIFKYSVVAKCIEYPYFTKISEALYKIQPSYSLANTIAQRHLSLKNYKKALSYFKTSFSFAANHEEKYKSYHGQANAYRGMNNHSKAREKTRKSINYTSDPAEAYTFIGDLYFNSYEKCKEGKSKVYDRGVFLAAYKMYKLANNPAKMKEAKSQFPSMEDIFTEGYEEENTIEIICWINEPVVIQRR